MVFFFFLVFFFFNLVIFKFPSSAVRGSLRAVQEGCGQAAACAAGCQAQGLQAGLQASRQEEPHSPHPRPLLLKLLRPAHHSAASLHQLLFILLENVML